MTNPVTAAPEAINLNHSRSSPRILALRLVVGLIHGVMLYITMEFLPGRDFKDANPISAPFADAIRLIAWLAPLPLLFGFNNLKARRLLIWFFFTIILLSIFGTFGTVAIWGEETRFFSVWLQSLGVIFIVHEFLLASQQERRKIAPYDTYFENTWQHAFQAGLALGFVGAYWVVIALGAALFNMIGLSFVSELVFSEKFAWVSSTTAFALGIHITDTRAGLTKGARQIGLLLLSVLAVLMTAILTAFILTLPFTGLTPLWNTGYATLLMLSAGGVMVLLINAAFQSGDQQNSTFMRLTVRLSTFPLLATVFLAGLGLWLRIDQYGLTPARVIATTQLAITGFYALTYLIAALKPGPWMAFLKPANITGAALVALTLGLLMTPILDPARLSVDNQIVRLNNGIVDPDDFDFQFLNDNRSGHWGAKALAELKLKQGSERDNYIALLANNPPQTRNFFVGSETLNERKEAIFFIGEGEMPISAYLPTSNGKDIIGACAKRYHRKKQDPSFEGSLDDEKCAARLIDLNFDRIPEMLVSQSSIKSSKLEFYVYTNENEQWVIKGKAIDRNIRNGWEKYQALESKLTTKQMLEELTVTPAEIQDINLNGKRIQFLPNTNLISKEALTSNLQVIGERTAPASVISNSPPKNLLNDCSPSNINRSFCFGLYRDITGDGVDEFIILQAHKGIEAQVFTQQENRWNYIGSGSHSFNGDFSTQSPEARLEYIQSIKVVPPKFGDLNINGITVGIIWYQHPPNGH